MSDEGAHHEYSPNELGSNHEKPRTHRSWGKILSAWTLGLIVALLIVFGSLDWLASDKGEALVPPSLMPGFIKNDYISYPINDGPFDKATSIAAKNFADLPFHPMATNTLVAYMLPPGSTDGQLHLQKGKIQLFMMFYMPYFFKTNKDAFSISAEIIDTGGVAYNEAENAIILNGHAYSLQSYPSLHDTSFLYNKLNEAVNLYRRRNTVIPPKLIGFTEGKIVISHRVLVPPNLALGRPVFFASQIASGNEYKSFWLYAKTKA